jgi:hypothetical protein
MSRPTAMVMVVSRGQGCCCHEPYYAIPDSCFPVGRHRPLYNGPKYALCYKALDCVSKVGIVGKGFGRRIEALGHVPKL